MTPAELLELNSPVGVIGKLGKEALGFGLAGGHRQMLGGFGSNGTNGPAEGLV